MRDLLVTLIVFGALPIIVMRPYVGILAWSWLGYMNPHRLTWSFAYDFPYAQVVAIATLIGFLFSGEKKHFPFTRVTVVWLLFILWMNVTTFFALIPEWAWMEWDRTMKIQLIALLTVILMQRKERLNALVWVIALSLGFFGIKGGLFSIATGGDFLVWGPTGSFIEDNNALALALIMTVPLLRYLQLQSKRAWIRLGLLAVMALCALSILTSHSRGALVASLAMGVLFLVKIPYKLRTGLVMILLLPVLIMMMPEQWFERMGSIGSFQEDESAMGRVNAWWFAWNLAMDRPLLGGGFQAFSSELFWKYAPNPTDFHDAHSIYFEILGEQGFVGLALFLLLAFLALSAATQILRRAKGHAELRWARELAAMLQVSLVGYAVGGAFLGLAYFDLYYHLIGMVVVLRVLVERQLSVVNEDASARPAAAGAAHTGRPVVRGRT